MLLPNPGNTESVRESVLLRKEFTDRLTGGWIAHLEAIRYKNAERNMMMVVTGKMMMVMMMTVDDGATRECCNVIARSMSFAQLFSYAYGECAILFSHCSLCLSVKVRY